MSYPKFCYKSAVWVLFCVTVMAHAVTAADTDCSQTLMADRPVLITSNNASKRCSYLITVPPETLPDHIFQVSLLSFNVGHRSEDGTSCQGSFAQIGTSIYCGGPTSPGTFLLYPASKHRNQLSINLHPGEDHQFKARVELLPRLTLQEKHPEMILATPGEHIPYTECDRVYTCLEYPGYCQVTSPNYPSAYARAINCSYYFKSPEPGIIIGGRHELFEIGDGNKLSQNCDDNDYIAIYDGEELISKFCGKIKKFPKIISKSTDILIRFVSTKAGIPSKGFVLSVETSPPHLTDQAGCFESLKVSGGMVQQLKSPHHWLAPNSHCSYTLAAKQGKQIWLLITQIKTKSNCSNYDDYVSIYDGNNLLMKYCKHNYTFKPIVSQSNQLKIVYSSPNGTLDATSKFYFIARFTAVNLIETGDHEDNTWCDTVFSTKSSGPFSLLNPRDLILHNYSSKNLTCKYYFRAPESFTVRLQLDHTSFEPLHRCNSVVDSCISSHFDKLVITENYEKNVLGCECGARKHAQIFQSKGSEMIATLQLNLNFDLLNSSLKHSPELYQFQGRYSFIPPTDDSIHCGLYSLTHEGLTFPTKHNLYVITPIMCHWKVKNIKYSDLKLLNLTLSTDCKHNYLIIKTETKDFKLCNDDHLSDIDLNDEVIDIYLIVNRGRPRLNLVWLHQGNDPSFIDIVANNDEECYGALTLSVLMGAAALCTMTLALVVALIIWRYRTSLWLSTWRRQTSYSSVTRHTSHTSGSFW